MSTTPNTPNNGHHPSAYQRMMERVHATQDKVAHSNLGHALGHAKKKAVHLGELTHEEAERIAHYLQRDLHDAARYLSETGNELSQWFRFDLLQLEHRWFEMFASVADRTRVELAQWAESAEMATTYLSGEIAGPGTLQCKQCEHSLPFHEPKLIPECPKCQGTVFRRVDDEASTSTND